MAVLPYSDPYTVDTVSDLALLPPFSDPVAVNTVANAGVPSPLPLFSDPATVDTQTHTEWQLPVTGSTVGANLTAPV